MHNEQECAPTAFQNKMRSVISKNPKSKMRSNAPFKKSIMCSKFKGSKTKNEEQCARPPTPPHTLPK